MIACSKGHAIVRIEPMDSLKNQRTPTKELRVGPGGFRPMDLVKTRMFFGLRSSCLLILSLVTG